MAKARSKTKAKSGSKTSKKALKKKPVAKAAKAKKPAPKKLAAKAKKPAPKKVAAKAKKPAPKKVVAAKKPAPAKKVLAPAVNRALAQAEVEGLINRLPPPVQPVVKTLRKLVLEAAPEASELLEDGAPAYFANGVFARIEPNEREVLVKFLKGGQLPSASELPGEGDQRSLSLTDVNELKESVLRKLVREAVMLNLSQPQASAQA
jgi:hypothetical protein